MPPTKPQRPPKVSTSKTTATRAAHAARALNTDAVRLYIGGLAPTAATDEIRRRFAAFGSVVDIHLATPASQNDARFAIVVLANSTPQLISRCIALYNNSRWLGHTLKVELAKKPFYQDKLAVERRTANQSRTDALRAQQHNITNVATTNPPPTNSAYHVLQPGASLLPGLPITSLALPGAPSLRASILGSRKRRRLAVAAASVVLARDMTPLTDRTATCRRGWTRGSLGPVVSFRYRDRNLDRIVTLRPSQYALRRIDTSFIKFKPVTQLCWNLSVSDDSCQMDTQSSQMDVSDSSSSSNGSNDSDDDNDINADNALESSVETVPNTDLLVEAKQSTKTSKSEPDSLPHIADDNSSTDKEEVTLDQPTLGVAPSAASIPKDGGIISNGSASAQGRGYVVNTNLRSLVYAGSESIAVSVDSTSDANALENSNKNNVDDSEAFTFEFNTTDVSNDSNGIIVTRDPTATQSIQSDSFAFDFGFDDTSMNVSQSSVDVPESVTNALNSKDEPQVKPLKDVSAHELCAKRPLFFMHDLASYGTSLNHKMQARSPITKSIHSASTSREKLFIRQGDDSDIAVKWAATKGDLTRQFKRKYKFAVRNKARTLGRR